MAEDKWIECETCGQAVSKERYGSHKFQAHGLEDRRAKPADDPNPKPPEPKTRKTEPPKDQPTDQPKKSRGWFGGRPQKGAQ